MSSLLAKTCAVLSLSSALLPFARVKASAKLDLSLFQMPSRVAMLTLLQNPPGIVPVNPGAQGPEEAAEVKLAEVKIPYEGGSISFFIPEGSVPLTFPKTKKGPALMRTWLHKKLEYKFGLYVGPYPTAKNGKGLELKEIAGRIFGSFVETGANGAVLSRIRGNHFIANPPLFKDAKRPVAVMMTYILANPFELKVGGVPSIQQQRTEEAQVEANGPFPQRPGSRLQAVPQKRPYIFPFALNMGNGEVWWLIACLRDVEDPKGARTLVLSFAEVDQTQVSNARRPLRAQNLIDVFTEAMKMAGFEGFQKVP